MIILLTLFSSAVTQFSPLEPTGLVHESATPLLVVATPIMSVTRLLNSPTLTGESLMAALCVYLPIGLVFALI
ncbi:MAG: hypothetical protein JO057_07705 [Chloroflexi bacterium]|nr:hypothetical protein [Chloroflexota bacterium]